MDKNETPKNNKNLKEEESYSNVNYIIYNIISFQSVQQKQLLSLENTNFEGQKRELNSPRSLKACEELGILPEELFHKNFEEFINNNPDMVNLPKDILEVRYDNINTYRKKLISEVKEKRKEIIKSINKSKEKSKSRTINEINDEEDIFDKEINEITDKGVKTLQKIRQKQKNIIEAQIETKIKNEILKIKSDNKEKKIKELNEKIREERKIKAILEDQKIKEKEIIRQKTLEKNIKEREEKNKEKDKAQEKRLKFLQEMQEKNQNEIIFRRTQNFQLLEKRKEKIMNDLRQREKKNKEKEEKIIKREKELEEKIKLKNKERIIFSIKKQKESDERLSRNKLEKEKSIENLKKILDKKHELTVIRLNGLISKRNQNMEEKKLKYEKKLKLAEDIIKKSYDDIRKRNDRILKHEINVENNVTKIEKLKNERILEKVKSQNYLFLCSLKRREYNNKKMQEKFNKINKRFEEKEKRISEGRINKIKTKTKKQEEEFIKLYEKNFNLTRLKRISTYRNKQKVEEMLQKDKKIRKYKIRKQNLIEKNLYLSNSIEKEKEKLINEFESVIQKNKELNPDLIKKLFPEDSEFYTKIKNMTDEALKKYNNENINDNSLILNNDDESKSKNKESPKKGNQNDIKQNNNN